MFEASEGGIVMTAGDTGIFTIGFDPDGLTPGTGDKVVLAVEDSNDHEVIRKETYPEADGSVSFAFLSDDTKNMKPDRRYRWNIRVFTRSGAVYTPYRQMVFRVLRSGVRA